MAVNEETPLHFWELRLRGVPTIRMVPKKKHLNPLKSACLRMTRKTRRMTLCRDCHGVALEAR